MLVITILSFSHNTYKSLSITAKHSVIKWGDNQPVIGDIQTIPSKTLDTIFYVHKIPINSLFHNPQFKPSA